MCYSEAMKGPKSKLGRPPRAAQTLRTRPVMVYLTPDERKRLDERRGTTPAGIYLREKGLAS